MGGQLIGRRQTSGIRHAQGLACECEFRLDITTAYDNLQPAIRAIGIAMASQRMFQLGLRRAAAPSLRVQHVGRVVGRRYVNTPSRTLLWLPVLNGHR